MIERITASVCIASILISTVLGLVLTWGPMSQFVGNLFFSFVLLFLASGTIFSINATLRDRRRAEDAETE